jgi:predicted TIM-barrel fold metal-dependent hydrolase
MIPRHSVAALLLASIAVTGPPRDVAAQVSRSAPIADHHVHLFSPRVAEVLRRAGRSWGQLTARDAIAMLDSSGATNGVVFSAAYMLGMPERSTEPVGWDELAEVEQENDWVRTEAARYAHRLAPFCSVNPLKDYAVGEVQRCARIGMRGLKLHFGNSNVDPQDARHVGQLRAVFAAANAVRLPIVVHMRPRSPRYGARDARTLIDAVLTSAPDVPVQIAHLAGWGGYDAATDDALGAFVDAFATGALDRKRIYFDLSGVVIPRSAKNAPEGTDLRILANQQREFPDWPSHLVARLRSLGVDRVLFASDWPFTSAAHYRAVLRGELGLTAEELRHILTNTAPYFEVK